MPRRSPQNRGRRSGRGRVAPLGFAVAVVAGTIAFAGSGAFGGVALDGSLGPAGALSGPAYSIPAALGRRAGANLFHSFSQFDLGRGESATFTGPAGIRNVISRVTGGTPSSLAGTLACDIPGADLFLVNPAGVVFREGAAVRVDGSFTVSTADYLRLEDGSRFASMPDPAGDAALSTAPPSAFGFLSPRPASIEFDGTKLELPPRSTLTVVGGDIRLSGPASKVAVPGGEVRVLSTGGPGEFPPTASAADLPPGGSITVQGTRVTTTGNGGGRIVLRGGRLVIEGNGGLDARNQGSQPGRGVDLEFTESITLTSVDSINTTTQGAGTGGDIRLAAPSVVLDGDGLVARVQAGSGPNATGHAGNIRLETERLDIVRGGILSTVATGDGDAGDIHIEARQGEGRVTVESAGEDFGILTESEGPGDAGHLSITARDILVRDAASLSATAYGGGRSGDIDITTDRLVVDGNGTHAVNQGIGSQGISDAPGGSIRIEAREVEILRHGRITTSTYGAGDAGDISIRNAERVLIDAEGYEPDDPTGLDAVVGEIEPGIGGTGKGGDILIQTRALEIRNGGFVATSTKGAGAAGNVTVHADSLRLDGAGENTAIATSTFGSGDAGHITLAATDGVSGSRVEIVDGASIATQTSGSGAGGTIRIDAASLGMSRGTISSAAYDSGDSGFIGLNVSGALQMTDGSVLETAALSSSASGITLATGGSLLLEDSQITSAAAIQGGELALTAGDRIHLIDSTVSSQSFQDGGNIGLASRLLILDRGTITANAVAESAGNIRIAAESLLPSADSRVTASSERGIQGEISLLGPVVDLSGPLTPLSASLLDAAARLPARCATRLPDDLSSFLVVGRGGLPFEPGEVAPATRAPAPAPALPPRPTP